MTYYYPSGYVLYRNLHYHYPLVTKGEGIYLYDAQGRKYLDASGGAAVVNIGHGVREIADIISAQAQKIGYLNGMQFTHFPVEKLSEQISEILPFAESKIFFLASGSEAVEASVKLSRQYWVEKGRTTKYQIISRRPSYHGNTLTALSLSARKHYKEIFQPLLTEYSQIPAPYCYRCFYHEEYPSCGLKCAYELEKTIQGLGEEYVSAFLTEIIGGASTGAAVPPPEYFQIIRRICDDYQVLLIADEVMTGIGRTGKWLACHHFQLSPDIIIMGKGLSGGYFPLSAVAVKKSIVDSIFNNRKYFLHAQTFAQHPVGCAVGLATLNYLKKHNLVERCSAMGDILRRELGPLLDHPHVGDIRGKGLLLGIEFVREKAEKKPFLRKEKYVEQFVFKAAEEGMVVWPNIGQADGINGDLILLAPPFIINPDEISKILNILKKVLSKMNNFE